MNKRRTLTLSASNVDPAPDESFFDGSKVSILSAGVNFSAPIRGQTARRITLERASAKRMGAKVTEMDTSHVPMLSRPQAVLDVIRDAAKPVT